MENNVNIENNYHNKSSNTMLAIGAEAAIYSTGNVIIKHRMKKSYRIAILDKKLRETRTRKEAKLLQKLYNEGFTPAILEVKGFDTLVLEKIEGEKLRDVLSIENYRRFAPMLAKIIRKMHDLGVIHGDLTTSNMLVNKNQSKIYFIDFGLSFYSEKAEDKAVDLHLLKQTLESKHYAIAQKCFALILKGYDDSDVVKRLKKVEQRGRNK